MGWESVWGSAATANWITAGATVAYTMGTLLLWRTTKRSVDTMRDAFKLSFLQAHHESQSSGVGGDSRLSQMIARMHARQFQALLKRVFPEEYATLLAETGRGASPRAPEGS